MYHRLKCQKEETNDEGPPETAGDDRDRPALDGDVVMVLT